MCIIIFYKKILSHNTSELSRQYSGTLILRNDTFIIVVFKIGILGYKEDAKF